MKTGKISCGLKSGMVREALNRAKPLQQAARGINPPDGFIVDQPTGESPEEQDP